MCAVVCLTKLLVKLTQAGAVRVLAGYAKSGTFNGKCTLCAGKGSRGGQRYSSVRGAVDCREWCA
jgi:hypothetical protein